MRTYPIPELASVLGAFVKRLGSKPKAAPVKEYPPFWPAARGSSGFISQHVEDAEEAEDWEDLLVLTPQDKREYRKWLSSLGKCSS